MAGAGVTTCTRPKLAATQVVLVVPGAGLLGEHAGEPLPVEVHPLIAGSVDALGQVARAVGVDIVQGGLGLRLHVGEQHAGDARLRLAGAIADLADFHQLAVRGVLLVEELGGAHQHRVEGVLPLGIGGVLGEAVEGHDAAAEAVGANLEAGAVAGERVRPRLPRRVLWSIVFRRLIRLRNAALAIVEEHLEHPVRAHRIEGIAG